MRVIFQVRYLLSINNLCLKNAIFGISEISRFHPYIGNPRLKIKIQVQRSSSRLKVKTQAKVGSSKLRSKAYAQALHSRFIPKTQYPYPSLTFDGIYKKFYGSRLERKALT